MLRLYSNIIGGFGALALLLIRLVMGLAFILHGWPKIQNPMGWMNSQSVATPALKPLAPHAGVGRFGDVGARITIGKRGLA